MRVCIAVGVLFVGMVAVAGCRDSESDSAPDGQPVEGTTVTAIKASMTERPEDNRLCLVCHEMLAEELIAKSHEEQDILCVDCHGPSRLHMEDEMQMTKPDNLMGRAEVDPFCKECHPQHKDEAVVDAFRKEWWGRDRPNGRVINNDSICTDCHGMHNIKEKQVEGVAGPGQAAEAEWASLFNGKDLTGWEAEGGAKWVVENGAIVGTQGENFAAGDLFTTEEFEDFQLTVTYRVEWPCNSGIWFRYQSPEQAYQADILEYANPECYSGTVYCPGKMFLAMNTNKSLVDREGWNTISIRAEGDHLQVWLNGHQVADVHDDSSPTGKIGFQVHPGEVFGSMKLVVREAMIQRLAPKR
jgi:hypothetical protein